MFLIDDLTTIEYLKLTLPVYLVHSKVHEMYNRISSLTTKHDKTETQRCERRRFNIMTEQSSDRDGGPYSMTIMVQSSLYLHAMQI